MDDITLQRAFEPFFTTKFLGRGLGLTAIRGILSAMGAQIHVESQLGQGTQCTLYFPALQEPSRPLIDETPALEAPSAQRTILLVDDEPILRSTVAELLDILGFQVIPAEDGLDALQTYQIRQKEISLVLMDLTMPRMNGWEAFDAMRAIDPSLPIILSSGFSEQSALLSRHGNEPTAFLAKPYRFADLKSVLDGILGPREL